MKNILFTFLAACIFCACEPSPVSEGRELYMRYFQNTFKDPSSIKIYSEDYTVDGSTVFWTLDVGGKNSFGGMVRETIRLKTVRGNLLEDDNGNLINKTELK